MSRYIAYSDVIGRYPKSTDVGSASDVSSTYIDYSEAWVDGALSTAYSTPFTSDNLTVKDLCIDYCYMKILSFKDTEKSKMIGDSLDSRVKKLLEGDAKMVLSDGTVVEQSVATAWSETQDYHPTFGIGDITDMHVSSSQLYDEEQARD